MENWNGENRLFKENHATDCQDIDELRRICCEHTEQTRTVRSEELSLQQQRNPTTVSQVMTQTQGLQNKVNCTSIMGNVFERPLVQEGLPPQNSTI